MFQWKSALFAVGLIGLTAGAASAQTAVVDRDANFRAGPGTQHSVLTVLRAGTAIDVIDCEAGWCAAYAGPRQGYIAQSLIAFGGSAGPYAAAPPPAVFAPRVYGPRYHGPRPFGPRAQAYYGPRYHPYYGPRYRQPRSGVSFWFGY